MYSRIQGSPPRVIGALFAAGKIGDVYEKGLDRKGWKIESNILSDKN